MSYTRGGPGVNMGKKKMTKSPSNKSPRAMKHVVSHPKMKSKSSLKLFDDAQYEEDSRSPYGGGGSQHHSPHNNYYPQPPHHAQYDPQNMPRQYSFASASYDHPSPQHQSHASPRMYLQPPPQPGYNGPGSYGGGGYNPNPYGHGSFASRSLQDEVDITGMSYVELNRMIHDLQDENIMLKRNIQNESRLRQAVEQKCHEINEKMLESRQGLVSTKEALIKVQSAADQMMSKRDQREAQIKKLQTMNQLYENRIADLESQTADESGISPRDTQQVSRLKKSLSEKEEEVHKLEEELLVVTQALNSAKRDNKRILEEKKDTQYSLDAAEKKIVAMDLKFKSIDVKNQARIEKLEADKRLATAQDPDHINKLVEAKLAELSSKFATTGPPAAAAVVAAMHGGGMNGGTGSANNIGGAMFNGAMMPPAGASHSFNMASLQSMPNNMPGMSPASPRDGGGGGGGVFPMFAPDGTMVNNGGNNGWGGAAGPHGTLQSMPSASDMNKSMKKSTKKKKVTISMTQGDGDPSSDSNAVPGQAQAAAQAQAQAQAVIAAEREREKQEHEEQLKKQRDELAQQQREFAQQKQQLEEAQKRHEEDVRERQRQQQEQQEQQQQQQQARTVGPETDHSSSSSSSNNNSNVVVAAEKLYSQRTAKVKKAPTATPEIGTAGGAADIPPVLEPAATTSNSKPGSSKQHSRDNTFSPVTYNSTGSNHNNTGSNNNNSNNNAEDAVRANSADGGGRNDDDDDGASYVQTTDENGNTVTVKNASLAKKIEILKGEIAELSAVNKSIKVKINTFTNDFEAQYGRKPEKDDRKDQASQLFADYHTISRDLKKKVKLMVKLQSIFAQGDPGMSDKGVGKFLNGLSKSTKESALNDDSDDSD